MARTRSSNVSGNMPTRLPEAVAIFVIFIGLYVSLSLLSYYPDDPSWVNTYLTEPQNLGGLYGAWLAQTLHFVFGLAAYLFAVLLFIAAYRLFRSRSAVTQLWTHYATQGIGYSFAMISLCGLLTMHFKPGIMPASAGGWLGEIVARGFINVLGSVGATLLLLAFLLGSLHFVIEIAWLKLIDNTGLLILKTSQGIVDLFRKLQAYRTRRASLEARQIDVGEKRKKFGIGKSAKRKPRIEPAVNKIKTSDRDAKEKQIPLFVGKDDSTLPPLALLSEEHKQTARFSEQSLEMMAQQLELKLADFKIDGKVAKVQTGPVVTCFELSLAPGTKARQVSNLENDLARALSVPSVRVVEVIPGKAVIGIEIPNEIRETVLFKEIVNSEAYEKAKLPLNIALGKDVVGNPMIINLQKMPHLLVAGTTGSGKSVTVHTMLMSLLFKSSPQVVRLILIDPKMLELNAYDGIPHLLTPVITDMKEATTALRWAVAEMDRRYAMMLKLSVRNLESYNQKLGQLQKEGAVINQGEPGETSADELELLPYIVVVIDEFADLMMIIGKPVEDLITRLAQKARAAGIHLIIATQRPSVDVITGLIKANVPSRIAFQVSSKIDSRTILDQNGAEQLLGQGDMLYLGPERAVLTRVHGAFVSDQEVADTVKHWCKQGQAQHIDLTEFMSQQAKEERGGDGAVDNGEDDPLYDEAVSIILETRKASISYLQRRLKVGYNRAARLVETMEDAGLVSPVQANGKREVLAPPSASE